MEPREWSIDFVSVVSTCYTILLFDICKKKNERESCFVIQSNKKRDRQTEREEGNHLFFKIYFGQTDLRSSQGIAIMKS